MAAAVRVKEPKPGEAIESKPNIPIKKPELLAPAGNLEKLEFAVRYGADAVYIGGKQFGLRAKAGNFTYEDMIKGVEFAHKHNAKVFVAANIIAHNEDLKGVHDYFKKLREIGVDAVIIADPALIASCREAAPELNIHLSTQTSTTNWRAVRFWKEEGISRIVLAREVGIKEIREIKEKVDVEIEAFIHGAMCISYSGRCVLSNHMTARDANRGGCAQSCRWKYDLFAEDGDGESGAGFVPVAGEDEDEYTMSSKDLCMIENLPALIDAGVDSLKIEGRMKSIHYVATVVRAYRQAIDAYCADPENYRLNPEWVDEIFKAAHRSLTTGFYFGKPTVVDQLYGAPEKIAKYDFAALVLGYDPETGIAVLQQRNNFQPGQEVEFFGPDCHFKQVIGKIWDEEGNELDAARHPLQIVKVKVDRPVRPYDMMRKRSG